MVLFSLDREVLIVKQETLMHRRGSSFTAKENNSIQYVILPSKSKPSQFETFLALINDILLFWKNLKSQARKIVVFLFTSQNRWPFATHLS